VGNRLEGIARRAGPKTVAAILFATLAVWGALGAIEAAQGPVEAEGGAPPHGFLGLFDLDAEYDVPAILSATYWLLAGIVLALAGQAREVGRGRYLWTALSAMLVFLAADEALGIHEKLEGATGVDWQILYVPVLAAVAGAGLSVFRRSPPLPRLLFACAALAALAAQVLEAVQWDGDTTIPAYRALMVPEEILEPTAAALLVVAGLVLLRGSGTLA